MATLKSLSDIDRLADAFDAIMEDDIDHFLHGILSHVQDFQVPPRIKRLQFCFP